MIKIENLTKKYSKTAGNFNINFELKEGKSLGIVGPNGAGKSTLIRQLMGFIKSDSGNIYFSGLDPIKNHDELMAHTGYIAGELNLIEHLTGKQYLKLVKQFKKDYDEEFFQKLIKYFDIDIDKKIKRMSKGMKQKIAIIAAVMNKPKFLILDEPTSGLDPVMQKRFVKLIKKLNLENNTTVIICSHILDEIMEATDELIFLKDGKIVENFVTNDFEQLEKLKEVFDGIYKDEASI
ncbi:ABC transporter ATP-binding protein [Mesoplasma photuris]|uniref:ABC transporter ATP-binding protein n=1 Tax=Mesoplasma photuris TaxID=217731 RepID=UPI000565E5A6|nr:ABC transporter ATP-binding protein [Mesoplasma photuris]